MNMQNIVNKNTSFHVKANYENDLRRFWMSDHSYATLIETLRTLYNLDPVFGLAVEYQDEEQDWVGASGNKKLILSDYFVFFRRAEMGRFIVWDSSSSQSSCGTATSPELLARPAP
jgi:hypothetical protein